MQQKEALLENLRVNLIEKNLVQPRDYFLDVYLGDELATTAKFAIKAGKSDENSGDESKEDSSEE